VQSAKVGMLAFGRNYILLRMLQEDAKRMTCKFSNQKIYVLEMHTKVLMPG
jgi:hypothetical protein